MAKVRFTAKGALVKVNSSGDGTTMLTVGLCTSATPPPQERALIDLTAMEDTVSVAAAGIEALSEFAFTELHDPDDASDDAIDTLYGSGDSVKWQLVFATKTAVGTTKTWTKSFTGVVFAITPEAVDGNSGTKRTIKVSRTGAITDTVA
jgi:hypothetical protein